MAGKQIRFHVMNNGTMQGEIIFFLDDKGYGFVSRDDGGNELFVHRTKFYDLGFVPAKGQRVSYEISKDERRNKLIAINLRPI
jgi:cold shock protein